MFLHLFELLQTFWTTEGFRAVLQLQRQRRLAAGRVAEVAHSHRVPAERFQTDVAAEAVDGLAQLQLEGRLKPEGAESRSVLQEVER